MNNSVKRVLSLLLAVCFEAELLPVLAFAAASEDVFERYGKKSISTEEFYGYSDNYDVIAADVESRIPDKENMEINLCQGYENNSETTTALNKIVDAYIADHPEHFWVERYSGTIGTKEKIFKIKIKMNLELSSEEKRSSFALAADELFNSLDISSDMSEYEKAKIIHDKLIEVISLDEDAENASNAYGAIVQRSAGSRAMQKRISICFLGPGCRREQSREIFWKPVKLNIGTL